MDRVVKVAVDAMGGDYAPAQIVKGALEALRERKDIKIVLVGQEKAINAELTGIDYDKERLSIIHAEDVITNDEAPVMAIRRKKNSSIVVAMNLVKNGEADAFVSAGSTGAVLVGGQLIVGRIKGIDRPPLAPLLPTESGVSLLIDPELMWMQDLHIWYSLPRWALFTWRMLLESRIRELPLLT